MSAARQWKKEYRKGRGEGGRPRVLAEFSNAASYAVTQHPDIVEALRGASRLASEIAGIYVDFIPGWKLHADWFRCMIAQAVAHDNGGKAPEHLATVYGVLGWDLRDALFPQYDDMTTVHSLPFETEDDGTVYFKILLEPTGAFPVGSTWRASSGRDWQVVEHHADGRIEFEDGNGSGHTITLAPAMARKMRRV